MELVLLAMSRIGHQPFAGFQPSPGSDSAFDLDQDDVVELLDSLDLQDTAHPFLVADLGIDLFVQGILAVD